MNTKPISFAAALFAAAVFAADAAMENASSFRYGGDIRLRQELWDDIPLPTEDPIVTRNGFNNTYRLRSRAFAAYDFTDWLTANVRLTHMFYDTIAGPESFDWPDELSLETANLEFRDLTGDGSKLVIGRQDIPAEGTAVESRQTVELDGRAVELAAYALLDECGYPTNYVRLRDLALLMEGTAAQFDVTWSRETGISVAPRHFYEYEHRNGTEGNVPFSASLLIFSAQ